MTYIYIIYLYIYIFDCCTSSISPVYQVDIGWQWLVQPPFHHCPQDSCTSHRNAGNGFSVGTASGPKEIWASFCVHDGISRSPWEVMGRLELTSWGCWEPEANGLNYIPWEDDIFSLERLTGFHPTTCIKQKLPVFKKVSLQGILVSHLFLQGIHLWSFDGLPDQYGQWDVEDVAVAVAATVATLESSLARPRLGSTGSSTGGILQPVPREQQRSWKLLIVFLVGVMRGDRVRRWWINMQFLNFFGVWGIWEEHFYGCHIWFSCFIFFDIQRDWQGHTFQKESLRHGLP